MMDWSCTVRGGTATSSSCSVSSSFHSFTNEWTSSDCSAPVSPASNLSRPPSAHGSPIRWRPRKASFRNEFNFITIPAEGLQAQCGSKRKMDLFSGEAIFSTPRYIQHRKLKPFKRTHTSRGSGTGIKRKRHVSMSPASSASPAARTRLYPGAQRGRSPAHAPPVFLFPDAASFPKRCNLKKARTGSKPPLLAKRKQSRSQSRSRRTPIGSKDLVGKKKTFTSIFKIFKMPFKK